MKRIGIMGGTFDPVHNGHLMLGHQALTEYRLDRVWYMPSGTPPHKKDHSITEANMRFEMIRLALQGKEGLLASDFELSRDGNTYTAQTLALLHSAHPDTEFYFIIGADSLYEIEKWYEPERVMAQAVLLAAGREYEKEHRSFEDQCQYLQETYGARIYRLHCEEMDLSSEEFRSLVRNGQSISSLVPPAVEAYISSHHLYLGENPDENQDEDQNRDQDDKG